MPFFLDGNPTQSEVSEAVNYLLSNFSSGITSDPNTGQITAPNNGGIIGYLYRYMAVKYADSYDGSVNFSNSPTGRGYFGLRNSNDAAESSNYADYVWYQATGGFGSTKYLWYITTGGRSIQLAVATAAPDVGWLQDTGASIDLDVLTSATTPVIAESFVSYFTPPVMQVPRTGGPLAPVFTGITPVMYATDKGVVVPFTDAQTDSAVGFVNNSWRIGNSSTTGNGDISYTNITIGSPVDYGDYAQWPAPTAMPNSPAYITVPVRYKNSLGVVSQASVSTLQLTYADPGAAGSQGYSIDISGYTAFVQNAGGAFTPTTATLSAVLTNVTSPTYSWAITGATPTSATTASVVVTPTSSSTGVTATLTVNGSNLPSAISKTVNLPVVYDGAPGTAGANGVMSAFPTIYIWTGSSTPPARPTTTSTYTWSTGAYSAPSGWSTQAPSNTTPGNYLWSITVPLNASATTTTSTLDWTNTSYPIRSVSYNGNNGNNGSNGSATFLVDRGSSTSSSSPSDAECIAAIGRTPVEGDICTVSYNSNNNAIVYRYTTGSYPWVLQTTYITGSLIVQNTITADKISSSTVLTQALQVGNSGSLPAISGTTMTGAGGYLYADGRFAFGNSSSNIVFDGTNAYVNGFTATTSQALTNNSLKTEGTLLTFTISQSGNVLVCCNGGISVFSNATTAIYVGGNLRLRVKNSGGTVLSTSYSPFQLAPTNPGFSGATYPNGVEIPFSLSTIVNLPAGTYTVTGQIFADWYNSSGTLLSPSATNYVFNGLTYFYQVKV